MNPYIDMLTGKGLNGAETACMPQTGNAPQMDLNAALGQLQDDPAGVLNAAHFNVPQEYVGNSRATVMHLIRTGQVGGPMMRMIAPMLARLGVR